MRHVFHMVLLILVAGHLFAPAQGAGAQADSFFVGSNGNDFWSGRLPQPNADRTDGPFATLHAACRAARKQDAEIGRAHV